MKSFVIRTKNGSWQSTMNMKYVRKFVKHSNYIVIQFNGLPDRIVPGNYDIVRMARDCRVLNDVDMKNYKL